MCELTWSSRRISAELGRIRSVSARVEARISELRPSEGARIDRLGPEELQDLARMTEMADFMVSKYAERQEMHRILSEFASTIRSSAATIGSLDDEISEMMLSAGDSLGRVREAHSRIAGTCAAAPKSN